MATKTPCGIKNMNKSLSRLKRYKKKAKLLEKTRLYRLMSILSQLSNRKIVTTAGLAEQFNVTKRSIQRDIQLLDTDFGLPIYLEGNIYKFQEDFSLRKIDVTSEEKLLLTLFYKLFSKVGQPFDATAKNLLDKAMLSSSAPDQSFDEKSIGVIKKEFIDYSRQLATQLKKIKYPEAFTKKINEYLRLMQQKLNELGIKDRVDIEFKKLKSYKSGEPVAIIKIPKTYFKSEIDKFDFSDHEDKRKFQIITYLPNKYIKSFRIALYVHMAFNFWGTHLKVRDVTCFDAFAKYLGFPDESKRFVYEFSHGTNTKTDKILITTASLYWEQEIPPVTKI